MPSVLSAKNWASSDSPCFCPSSKKKEIYVESKTHLSLFALLLLDAFTAIFGITAMILLLTQNSDQELTLLIIENIWLAFRWLSLSQHLITSLVSILFLSHPNWGFSLRTIGKSLDAVPFILVMVAFRISRSVLIGVDIFNFLMIVAIVVSWMLNVPTEVAKQRKHFGLLAVSLYLLVCLPNTVLNCLVLQSGEYLPLTLDVLYATNFYFIMNSGLFYLGLKIKEEEQEYEGAIRCA
ncbi:hypothetical protein NL108_003918 [Boleophthalmus pectinirostris]|nr:hypothetical protein NL108_003918 [Boleophthalmus pectinirostris]